MKFHFFREFKNSQTTLLSDVAEYLSSDLAKALSDLRFGLIRLNFADNFESFTAEVTIPSGEEVSIRNELKDGLIPTGWIAIRKDQYSYAVCDGEAEWTREFVSLKNSHPTDETTLTVMFFR